MDWFLYDNGLRHEKVKKIFYAEESGWLIHFCKISLI